MFRRRDTVDPFVAGNDTEGLTVLSILGVAVIMCQSALNDLQLQWLLRVVGKHSGQKLARETPVVFIRMIRL